MTGIRDALRRYYRYVYERGAPDGRHSVCSVAVRPVIGKADEGMFFCTGAFFSYRCPVSAAYLQG